MVSFYVVQPRPNTSSDRTCFGVEALMIPSPGSRARAETSAEKPKPKGFSEIKKFTILYEPQDSAPVHRNPKTTEDYC
jgi:hypothetical protein